MQIKYNKSIYSRTNNISTAASQIDNKKPSEHFSDTNLEIAKKYEELLGKIHELCVTMEAVIQKDVSDINKSVDALFACDSNISSKWKGVSK